MSLSPETHLEIEAMVRGGFEQRDRIVEIFTEEMYESGELDPGEVASAVDAAFARLDAEKTTWPQQTDCDRLDAVFDALNQRGIIALQNAGYTQSDGYDDIREAHAGVDDRDKVIGYCFYQGQDLERAVSGHGLLLAFGPIDPAEEETRGPAVGRIVVSELQKAGFDVEWGGTFNERIHVPKLVWKKR